MINEDEYQLHQQKEERKHREYEQAHMAALGRHVTELRAKEYVSQKDDFHLMFPPCSCALSPALCYKVFNTAHRVHHSIMVMFILMSVLFFLSLSSYTHTRYMKKTTRNGAEMVDPTGRIFRIEPSQETALKV